MARKRIQGITIELDGETKGLDKALKDVNKRSNDLSSELREVEKALKFNPGNTDLLAQQQEILQQQVENSTKKLDQLKQAQQQVEQQFKSGKISEEEYRAFRREVVKTESQIDGFKKKLDSVDDTKAIDKVEKDIDEVGSAADKASGKVDSLGSALGGLAAGAGVGGAISESLNFAELDTQIDISFNVPEESKKTVKQAVKDVTAYGLDAEEALEGVRRQWALNADASDETNAKVVEGAATISKAYAGIDFTELIQETNEIAEALGISNEEALGLTDSLLEAGFPPEQLDIISEYGHQLAMAGYDAEEIQAIMAAGVDTKSWNIDNLLDGLKEGRIGLAEFGNEIPATMDELLKKTDISKSQLKEWGSAVAEGGEDGKVAMLEAAKALAEVEDATARNEIGVQMFGTMWEDQGGNIIDTLINAKDSTFELEEGMDGLNKKTSELDASPTVQLKDALNEIKTALGPLLEQIAGVVSQFAQWVKENPQLVATLTVIATILGVVGGALVALAPIIYTIINVFNVLKTILPIIGAAFASIGAPVWIVIGVITALIAIITALWTNWDVVSQWLAESWEWIKQLASTIFTAIGEGISIAWERIKLATSTAWEWIKTAVSTVWNWMKDTASSVFNWIKDAISTAWENVKTATSAVWNGIKSFISGLWNGIKSTASTVFNAIKSSISNVWDSIKSTTSSLWNGIKSTVTRIWDGMKSTVSNVFNGIKDTITGVWDTVKSKTDDIWTGITDSIKGAVNGVISAINGMINGLNNIKIKLPTVPDWVPGMGGKGGQTLGFSIPNIPSLDVGTNYVKKDGLAMIHEGEAVVPKKYNPAAGGGVGQQMVINPAPVYLDDQLIGEIILNIVDQKLSTQFSMNSYVKGER